MTPLGRVEHSAVPVAAVGAPVATAGPPHARRGQGAVIEMVVGAILVGVAAAGGLWFALRPASGALDGWLLDLVGASRSPWFSDPTALRYPWVVVAGAVAAAAVTFPRDRARSLACLVGPPLAVLVCELVAKPLVGRTLGGALSYPSGSTVGAAALGAVAVLAAPARWRPLAILLGSTYAIWMAVAVVALRWHYPTDALAGLALGVGVVLLMDGASWLVFVRRAGAPGRAQDRAGGAAASPSPR